jgi:hypothetical protein
MAVHKEAGRLQKVIEQDEQKRGHKDLSDPGPPGSFRRDVFMIHRKGHRGSSLLPEKAGRRTGKGGSPPGIKGLKSMHTKYHKPGRPPLSRQTSNRSLPQKMPKAKEQDKKVFEAYQEKKISCTEVN